MLPGLQTINLTLAHTTSKQTSAYQMTTGSYGRSAWACSMALSAESPKGKPHRFKTLFVFGVCFSIGINDGDCEADLTAE